MQATKVALGKEKLNYDSIVKELEGEAQEVAQEITTLRKANANLMEQNKSLNNQIDDLSTLTEQKTGELAETIENMEKLRVSN